jgi:general secretion pathway protein A
MYNKFFGFGEKPFNVTPDPRLFYENEAYEEAYSSLLYGIRERKGFLLLTGEVGTGKTTILQRLMDELEPTVRFVYFYNTNLSFAELLTFICQELGLSVQNSGQLGKITALNAFLLEQLSKGSTVVLFVDEAQNLKEEVFENLRLLSNLETRREKLLQIVLAGQPELENKLDRVQLRQLKQRIFSHSRLEPLQEDEVAAFIDYRLDAVGYGGDGLFPRAVVHEIVRHTNGIPRLINIMCDNALLLAYAEGHRNITLDCIREVARDLGLPAQGRSRPSKPSLTQPLSTVWGRYTRRRRPASQTESQYVTARKTLPEEVRVAAVPAPIPEPPPAERPTAVTPELLEGLRLALTEAMGPMAGIVIQDYLNGHSATASKKLSFEKLIQLVSPEILDHRLREGFQEKMFALAASLNGNAH